MSRTHEKNRIANTCSLISFAKLYDYKAYSMTKNNEYCRLNVYQHKKKYLKKAKSSNLPPRLTNYSVIGVNASLMDFKQQCLMMK